MGAPRFGSRDLRLRGIFEVALARTSLGLVAASYCSYVDGQEEDIALHPIT
jgi:hypothetical protein